MPCGDDNLNDFASQTIGVQLELLNKVQDQLCFKTMPPAAWQAT